MSLNCREGRRAWGLCVTVEQIVALLFGGLFCPSSFFSISPVPASRPGSLQICSTGPRKFCCVSLTTRHPGRREDGVFSSGACLSPPGSAGLAQSSMGTPVLLTASISDPHPALSQQVPLISGPLEVFPSGSAAWAQSGLWPPRNFLEWRKGLKVARRLLQTRNQFSSTTLPATPSSPHPQLSCPQHIRPPHRPQGKSGQSHSWNSHPQLPTPCPLSLPFLESRLQRTPLLTCPPFPEHPTPAPEAQERPLSSSKEQRTATWGPQVPPQKPVPGP